MAPRAAVQSLLAGDTTLGVEKVYSTNSVDTPEEEFFAILQWGTTTPAFNRVGSDRLTVWLHDRQRDYGRINKGLTRVADLLTGTIHRAGGDGITLSTAEWLGESQDLFDGGYNTITRYAEFAVVSRYASV